MRVGQLAKCHLSFVAATSLLKKYMIDIGVICRQVRGGTARKLFL